MKSKTQNNTKVLKYILSCELENREIAEELQQKVIQLLSTAYLKMNLYEEDLKIKERVKDINMVKELIMRSINEINKLYILLFPIVLIDLGLIPALKQLFNELKKNKILIKIRHIDIRAGRKITNDMNIYKVIFILLKTIKQNLRNTTIEFSMVNNGSGIVVSLKDIGKSQKFSELLSLNKKEFYKKFIIFIERLKLINGSYSIKTYNDRNKEIIVKIPVISF